MRSGVTFSITFFCSIASPSISHRYCCSVIFLTSSPDLGHLYLPSTKRLYIRRNPSPSNTRALILSFLLPQKRNMLPSSYGFSLNSVLISIASPSMLLRRSVLFEFSDNTDYPRRIIIREDFTQHSYFQHSQ